MRAARLISLVLLLQARETMTGTELAHELEVSERTIARDMLALAEAGVPVYADRGRAGGYRLLEGYRTRLTGLGRAEAEALFLSGVPGPLRDMGLAEAGLAARLKVSAALLPTLRDAPESAAQRFHLDAPGWFKEAGRPPLLPVLSQAVWGDEVISARYRQNARTLEPYGLVLKAGVWYLVARSGRFLTYRVDRFETAGPTGQTFTRDPAFDIATFWDGRSAEFERSLLRDRITVRLTEAGLRRLPHVVDRAGLDEALATADESDDGWTTIRLPVESMTVAFSQMLTLGAEAEVIEPAELRARMADSAARLGELYQR